MQTKIVIRDFERTENLQNYLETRIEDTIYPFLQKYPKSQVQVKVEEDRHRSLTRRPHFECTVLLTIDNSGAVIRIQRSSDHFYTCVQEVTDTLRDVLRREHRRIASLQSKRKITINNIPYIDPDQEAADADDPQWAPNT